MKKSVKKYLFSKGYEIQYKKFSYWDVNYAVKDDVEIPLSVVGASGNSSYIHDIDGFNLPKFQRAFYIQEQYYTASDLDKHQGNVLELISKNGQLYVFDPIMQENIKF